MMLFESILSVTKDKSSGFIFLISIVHFTIVALVVVSLFVLDFVTQKIVHLTATSVFVV